MGGRSRYRGRSKVKPQYTPLPLIPAGFKDVANALRDFIKHYLISCNNASFYTRAPMAPSREYLLVMRPHLSLGSAIAFWLEHNANLVLFIENLNSNQSLSHPLSWNLDITRPTMFPELRTVLDMALYRSWGCSQFAISLVQDSPLRRLKSLLTTLLPNYQVEIVDTPTDPPYERYEHMVIANKHQLFRLELITGTLRLKSEHGRQILRETLLTICLNQSWGVFADRVQAAVRY